MGDLVLSVGATPLVNERGLPISGIDLETVRSLIKDTQGDSITLTVQRPAAAPSTQLSKPAAAAGPTAAGPAATARDADDDETVVLIRDAQGRFGLNVDQDDRGIFVKQVRHSAATRCACTADAARIVHARHMRGTATAHTRHLHRGTPRYRCPTSPRTHAARGGADRGRRSISAAARPLPLEHRTRGHARPQPRARTRHHQGRRGQLPRAGRAPLTAAGRGAWRRARALAAAAAAAARRRCGAWVATHAHAVPTADARLGRVRRRRLRARGSAGSTAHLARRPRQPQP